MGIYPEMQPCQKEESQYPHWPHKIRYVPGKEEERKTQTTKSKPEGAKKGKVGVFRGPLRKNRRKSPKPIAKVLQIPVKSIARPLLELNNSAEPQSG
jgi:hypothetical protein